jgi:hypothetical protein
MVHLSVLSIEICLLARRMGTYEVVIVLPMISSTGVRMGQHPQNEGIIPPDHWNQGFSRVSLREQPLCDIVSFCQTGARIR